MHPACERVRVIKNPGNTSQRAAREIFANEATIVEMGPQSVINERESNGKLIGFDDSQVWA